jgi:hypothetical protein
VLPSLAASELPTTVAACAGSAEPRNAPDAKAVLRTRVRSTLTDPCFGSDLLEH